ncbi:uncharacterized protein LOC111339685 [Stylophora pistillata]|uniref:uncharacterized protein LOC111339685 n=1 Tax=Stylophora pistillata TaxID=50429 RepID=UPI000C04F1E0|nr:uncharacterized protein LOC111339685 [Stylophora pistillata]
MTSNENKLRELNLCLENSLEKHVERTTAETEELDSGRYITGRLLKTAEVTEAESKETKDSLVYIEQQIKLTTRSVEEATNRTEKSSETTEATEKPVSPPFVYLTQTEKCLRSKFSRNLELHNPSKCRCDVIVLSYREECHQVRPAHFIYLFDNTTTWGSGRNKLFFHATKRNILNYIYYIFLDDDISLRFNGQATPALRKLNPIQVFQNWLLDYEPAVGVVDYETRKEGRLVRLRKVNICGRRYALKKTEANPTIFFDPLFHAIHAKAVTHIYPLDTRYEKKNWWLTDKYLASVVEMKFRGQALLYFPLTVENGLHRPYPGSLAGTRVAWQKFIKHIQTQAPDKYKNHPLFENFRKNPTLYVDRSWTYCMEITRHQEIVPFAHLTKGLPVAKEQPEKHLRPAKSIRNRVRRKRFPYPL